MGSNLALAHDPYMVYVFEIPMCLIELMGSSILCKTKD
jgi:hypothetical protein